MMMILLSTAYILTIVTILGIILTGTLVVYRLYWHPLAKFPGPKLSAATHWVEFYYDILHGEGGQFTFRIDRMHQEYGPIVRINPDELHIQDPDFHEKLYGGPGQVRDKYPPAANHAGTDLGTFGTINHYQHRERRAAIAPLFSRKTVLERENLITNHVEHLCEVIKLQCSQRDFCELRATCLAYTTDVIREYFFGDSNSLLDDENAATTWYETMNALSFFIPIAKQFGWMIPLSKKLPTALVTMINRSLGQAMLLNKDMRDRAETAYSSRNANVKENTLYEKVEAGQHKSHSTLYDEIMSSRIPESEKLPVRMTDEGLVVIAAGSETTARTLSTAIFHILDNPKSHQMLRDELKTAIPDISNTPPLKQLEQLPFLSATVKESLRFSCVPLSRLPIVLPNEPLQYHDWLIPAGTAVAMSTHKIHMDEDIFPSPLSFKPDRWLSSDTESLHRMTRHLVPFNKGNRACPGGNLAQAQLYMVIAMLFRRFEFGLVDTVRDRDVDPVRDCFIGLPSLASEGVKVVVRRELG